MLENFIEVENKTSLGFFATEVKFFSKETISKKGGKG